MEGEEVGDWMDGLDAVWVGESGSVDVEDEEDEEVGDLTSFELESWEVWKEQVKVGLYSLSRMPEHLR